MLEIQHRRPIVALILLEPTRRAARLLGDVDVIGHGEVEGVAADDLVDVWGDFPWGDQSGRGALALLAE